VRHSPFHRLNSGWLFAALLLLGLSACQEETPFVVGPQIALDTTYVDLNLPPTPDRVVLLEDFTGVQCVNCPEAHDLAKTLGEAHPGRVVAVSEHNYFLGGFANSSEDLRTPEAFAIDALLGPTTLWPIGMVNRRRFAGEPAVLLAMSKWTGYVEEELSIPPLADVQVSAALSQDGNSLEVTAQVHFLETVEGALRLSVMVLESGIVDPQQTLTGVVDDYVHDHVLRVMPTPATGALIPTTTERGRVLRRIYTVDLPPNWDRSRLEVVAFVHYGELANNAVLQVAAQKL
jgi:hypothetical protein